MKGRKRSWKGTGSSNGRRRDTAVSSPSGEASAASRTSRKVAGQESFEPSAGWTTPNTSRARIWSKPSQASLFCHRSRSPVAAFLVHRSRRARTVSAPVLPRSGVYSGPKRSSSVLARPAMVRRSAAEIFMNGQVGLRLHQTGKTSRRGVPADVRPRVFHSDDVRPADRRALESLRTLRRRHSCRASTRGNRRNQTRCIHRRTRCSKRRCR